MGKLLCTLLGCGMLLFGCKEKTKSASPLMGSDPESKLEAFSPTQPKQGDGIKIIPIEHATAVLEWGNTTIYIDPTMGAKAFKDQKKPDIILITDIHGDHFSMTTLEGLNTDGVKIIAPKAVVERMPKKFAKKVTVMNNGDTITYGDVGIEALPMYNLRKEALQFHTKGRGNGYVLNLGSQRVYFSGDTEDIPEMRALKNIDKAFICMNLPYTMTVESAASAVLEFKPKQVYPYHYRGKPDVSDVAKFKKLVNEGNPNIEVVQLDWYPNDDF